MWLTTLLLPFLGCHVCEIVFLSCAFKGLCPFYVICASLRLWLWWILLLCPLFLAGIGPLIMSLSMILDLCLLPVNVCPLCVIGFGMLHSDALSGSSCLAINLFSAVKKSARQSTFFEITKPVVILYTAVGIIAQAAQEWRDSCSSLVCNVMSSLEEPSNFCHEVCVCVRVHCVKSECELHTKCHKENSTWELHFFRRLMGMPVHSFSLLNLLAYWLLLIFCAGLGSVPISI